MKNPWWLRLPEKLSRLAFAFVLIWDNAIIKKCQYCGSWKLKVIWSNEKKDKYIDKVQCQSCGAVCICEENWTEINKHTEKEWEEEERLRNER